MSGICGYYNYNGENAEPETIKKMIGAISHRGPDGQGMYMDNQTALGLSKLLLIADSQGECKPVISPCGRYALVYDGEIFNYLELRGSLREKGYRFNSPGDGEALLFAYMEWGEGCLSKLNGGFALAVYDSVEKSLFCARDRYGIKPFYYARSGDIIAFGSEQKAIFAHPLFTRRLDLDGVVEYFTFQNLLTDHTFEKLAKALPPGCCFYIGQSVGSVKPRRWWDFHFEEESDRGEVAYAEELDFLLSRAVGRQLAGDAEPGCFLSGGMDSGSIACIAGRAFPHLKTFTCGYDMTGATDIELYYDERRKAEIMARAFQTEHYEMVLQYGDIERAMSNICFHVEEPRVGPTYTNYYISQLAGKFVKVAFSGSGGDELFGGYPWRYYRGMSAKSFDEFADNYYVFWQRLIPTRMLKEVFSPVAGEFRADPRQIFREVFKGHEIALRRPEDYINHALYFEAKTFLPGMLAVEDRLSMAHGLGSRAPMLDNDLCDFAQRLPVKYKLGGLRGTVARLKSDESIKSAGYYIKTNHGKYLLRKTMEKYIPESIRRADKQGFSAPDATWFRNECANYVRSVIYNDKSRVWSFLNPYPVREL
ncbi:MAG: asparagine synthase (glutamine-hydrolyzing), partial [Oscillospiraceae bacterium]|nr:asparagine synthase (glutamine-hydrolyzing) [Oscillospiraceae bacterium]